MAQGGRERRTQVVTYIFLYVQVALQDHMARQLKIPGGPTATPSTLPVSWQARPLQDEFSASHQQQLA